MTDRGLLRAKNGHEADKVSFIELFFDLVFVFAVTQLSHSLIGHFSLTGGFQTLMLLLAVWWVWIFTAWVTNWLDPEKLPVRIALLVMMALGLVLSASLPEAFEGGRGLVFAAAHSCLQVGRSLFFLWAVRGNAAQVLNFQRILAWLGAAAVFWIIGGCAAPEVRMGWWALALGIEYLSPSMGFATPGLGRASSKEWDVSGHHLAERCGLFIIIALGESILVTGATFSGMTWSGPVLAAFGASVIGSIAMWWLYFDTASGFGSEAISSSDNPGYLARLAYTYLHLFLVAGIILAAAGDEFVLAHPVGHGSAKITIAVLGSAALYLSGSLVFKRAISGRTPLSHFTAIGVLALLVPAAPHLAPWILASLATLVLCGVAGWERHARCLKKE